MLSASYGSGIGACLRIALLSLALGGAQLVVAGCSGTSSTDPATLSIAQPQQQLPGAAARTLRLSASGDQACPGDAELTDIETEESENAVLVAASFKDDSGFSYCELRTPTEAFEVQLERPLGGREVIDVSGDRQSVIWSPEQLEQHRKTAELTEEDALRFATSRFPEAAGSKCIPVLEAYFECRYIRGGQRYRLILAKEIGGRFSVFDRPIPDPTCPLAGGQPGCPGK